MDHARRVASLGVAIAFCVALVGAARPSYHARVRTTSHGIPHVLASDYAGLGYGYGWAFARDNLCVLAEEVDKVNAQRAMHFGVSEGYEYRANGSGFVNNVSSDFFYALVMDEAALQSWLDSSRAEIRDVIRGFARGYNRYLADTGLANLPAACRNQPWVRPITELDLMKRFYSLILLASQGFFIEGLVGVEPPAGGIAAPPPTDAQVMDALAADPCALPSAGCLGIGSNAYAFGADATGTGAGLLLGNPHFPWIGSERFHVFHYTIPDGVDVFGMALYGVPVPLIGFNEDIAWSHTCRRPTASRQSSCASCRAIPPPIGSTASASR